MEENKGLQLPELSKKARHHFAVSSACWKKLMRAKAVYILKNDKVPNASELIESFLPTTPDGATN